MMSRMTKKPASGNMVNETTISSPDYKESHILKAMEAEFGYTAAHSILSHVSKTTLKSKAEILSNFETFSKIMKEVYTEEVAQKQLLDRLPNFVM